MNCLVSILSVEGLPIQPGLHGRLHGSPPNSSDIFQVGSVCFLEALSLPVLPPALSSRSCQIQHYALLASTASLPWGVHISEHFRASGPPGSELLPPPLLGPSVLLPDVHLAHMEIPIWL